MHRALLQDNPSTSKKSMGKSSNLSLACGARNRRCIDRV